MVSDPYSVLGIGKDAGKDEIKKAYRKKAKEYHPDLHPNDPKAAEKMNEINEAYDMLCNPEKYQKREQNSSGYRGYYGRNTYNQNTYSGSSSNQEYGSYWGFDFEDLFGFGQRHQEIQKPSRDINDTEDIKEAVDFICIGNYEYANRILNQVVSARRDARWHYLSALANYGLGNGIRALEEIQRAMQMDPENQTYSQLYNSMRQSGNAYYTSSQSYQQYADGMQQYCRNFLMLQCFCMFCRCC